MKGVDNFKATSSMDLPILIISIMNKGKPTKFHS